MPTAQPKTPQDILDRAYELESEGMTTIPAHTLLGHRYLENPQLRTAVRALKSAGLLKGTGEPGFLALA